MLTTQFQKVILSHYRREGRAMPWRRTRDPYRILVSEIMLQQTQVSRVLKFYPTFIKKFPNFRALARARISVVLRAWQGMGYNRRALALQRLSRIVLEKFNGRLPRERAALESLPGIGKATAGAIRAFAWNEPEVFIETNIRRVFIHFFFSSPLNRPGRSSRRPRVTDDEVKRYIERTLPRSNAREWYWALMDYGAMLGGNMSVALNPNQRSAHYKKQSRFLGSNRELRGKILRFLLQKKKISLEALAEELSQPIKKIKAVVATLVKEEFVALQGRFVTIVR